MKGPIGRRMPPTTAMIRMSITAEMPPENGATCEVCQTSMMPPIEAMTPAKV